MQFLPANKLLKKTKKTATNSGINIVFVAIAELIEFLTFRCIFLCQEISILLDNDGLIECFSVQRREMNYFPFGFRRATG